MNLVFRTSLLVLFCSLNSCVAIPNMDEEEKASSLEEVVGAVSKAWGNADPLSMEVGDFVLNRTYRSIENTEEKLYLQEGITIAEKLERETDWKYTFLYQTEVLDANGNSQLTTVEDIRTVGKEIDNENEETPEQEKQAFAKAEKMAKKTKQLLLGQVRPMAEDFQMSLGFEKLINLAYACQLSDNQKKYCTETLGFDSCDVKCFNLKVTETSRPAPPLISQRPHCSGLPDCTLNETHLSFDWAVYYKKDDTIEKQKMNYSISTAKDLPFFSRVTNYCYQTLVNVGTQMVSVRFCNKLEDYQKAGAIK